MAALLESGARSDVVFVVAGEKMAAHSVVLMARSEVLRAQLSNGMKESGDKVILVDDVEPATFQVLLRFLYTDNLNCESRVYIVSRSFLSRCIWCF